MAAPTNDPLVCESLLREAAAGFEALGLSLADAYDSWVAIEAEEDTLVWMAGLIEQAGWWHGRLTSELAHSSLIRLDHPDDAIQ